MLPAIEQILADNRSAIASILKTQGQNSTSRLVLAMDELNDRLGACRLEPGQPPQRGNSAELREAAYEPACRP